jgi:glycerol-3-phosphate dehydrogenase
MVRDLRRLADTTFHLLVVGAGIYGAVAAWDATLRGLSVAIIDRGDFGGATSFNSLKTLHGGLRSLQALDLRQMRLFIRERRAFARIAPHLVRVLPCVVPTYGLGRRSAPLLKLGLSINDLVARDRNEGLEDRATHLPASHLISRDECLRLSPAIDPAGVTGGAVWHDYQMTSADRLTLAFVLSARRAGASAANYVAATRLLAGNGRAAGVAAEDRLTGRTFDVRAAVVLNATGPWAAAFPGLPADAMPPLRWSRAMNLVTRPFVKTHACGGLSGGRFMFAVPWRHVSIVGTSHDAYEGGPDLLVTRRHIEMLLHEARAAFPGASLQIEDVRLAHRGLLPAVATGGADVTLVRESLVVDHRASGLPGLVTIIGVRYTTARQTAAEAVDVVFQQLGYSLPPACRTDRTPLTTGLDDGGPPSRGEPPRAACAATDEQVRRVVREEAAVRLADAVIRRTEAGSAGHPGPAVVASAARIMAAELGWNADRTREEIANVESFYRIPE